MTFLFLKLSPPPPGLSEQEKVKDHEMPNEVIAAWTRYKKVRSIGAGACGQAFLVEATSLLTSSTNIEIPPGFYVIKRMLLSASDDVLRSAATEVKILELLEPHENIVRFYEHFFDDEGAINVVMEYCPAGDLESMLQFRNDVTKQPLSLCEVIFFAFQLFVAVNHLHKSGVLHRDLKPSNIFVCPADGHETMSTCVRIACGSNQEDEEAFENKKRSWLLDGRKCVLKIADFGISRVLERTGSVAKTVLGTPFYIAPELCNGQTYGGAADMWALGCIIWELASGGRRCFGGDNLMAVVRSICSGVIPPLPNPQLQQAVMPMVVPLLQIDEAKRFKAEDCLRAFFLPDEGDTNFADDFEDPED